MGIMVGDDGAGHRIGVAPGARWIGCRNMDNQGVGSPETYSECYQWFIAPTDLSGLNPRPDLAPDVINNSWACTTGEGCTDPEVLLTVVNNVRAAGILTVHSAGNSGPGCESIDEPATIYEASFSVGATDDTDTIAGFSSRGPVTVDHSNRMKPNVSAPGVHVHSSLRGTGYGFMSGTSMAAPHVAGLAALLISLNPSLRGQVDTLENLIEGSSAAGVTVVSVEDCGGILSTGIPNNTFGWGRVDALAAAQQTPHYLAVLITTSPDWVLPGQPITYTLAVTHQHLTEIATHVVLTDTLPVGTTFITATQPHSFDGTRVRWDLGSLAPSQVTSVTLTVQAPSSLGVITNDLYSARSDQVTTPVTGIPVNTAVVTLLYLLMVAK